MFYKEICSVWPSLMVRRVPDRPVLWVSQPREVSIRPREPGKDGPEQLRLPSEELSPQPVLFPELPRLLRAVLC